MVGDAQQNAQVLKDILDKLQCKADLGTAILQYSECMQLPIWGPSKGR